MAKHVVNTVLGYEHLNFGSQSQLLRCDLVLQKIHDVHLRGNSLSGAAQRALSFFGEAQIYFLLFFPLLFNFTPGIKQYSRYYHIRNVHWLNYWNLVNLFKFGLIRYDKHSWCQLSMYIKSVLVRYSPWICQICFTVEFMKILKD